jgi:hypothetical protein
MPSKCNTCPGRDSQKNYAPRSLLQCVPCAKRETEAKPSAGGIIYKSKHDGKWYWMKLNRSSWKFQSYGELIPLAILEGEDEADKKKARQQNVDFTNATARARKKQKDEMKNDKEYREKVNKKKQGDTIKCERRVGQCLFEKGQQIGKNSFLFCIISYVLHQSSTFD